VARTYEPTPLDARILTALARFRFVTRDTLELAGVGKDKKHRVDRLKALEDARLIVSSLPIAKEGGGRLSKFYWLTPKGAAQASLELGREVTAPLKATISSTSHPHMEGVARLAVLLDRLAAAYGGTVERLAFADEMQAGGGFKSMTLLPLENEKPLVPDMLAVVRLADGKLRPLAVEYENGSNVNDARNALGKRDRYQKAIGLKLIGKALGCEERPARLLIVCVAPDLRAKVWKGWSKPPASEWPQVFLQDLAELEANPKADWFMVGYPRAPLFKS
jgi:hypothetical protein